MEIILMLGIVAAALVALNFGLQRLARPDKGCERIAGCCGMALPEDMLRLTTETLPAAQSEVQQDTQLNKQNEVYHEL